MVSSCVFCCSWASTAARELGGARRWPKGRGTHIDGDVDAEAVVFGPVVQPIVPLLCGVVADNKSVLGQLLEEALRRRAIDEEVKRLRDSAEGQEREEGPHVGDKPERIEA